MKAVQIFPVNCDYLVNTALNAKTGENVINVDRMLSQKKWFLQSYPHEKQEFTPIEIITCHPVRVALIKLH